MIKYMNEHHGDRYNFRYSTPSDYVNALARLNVSWPIKYDDMYPYSDNPKGYWTGYFSSRPNDKAYIRRVSQILHASSQLFSFSSLRGSDPEPVLEAKHTLLDITGIMQHHDAITGTSKLHVVKDYERRLYEAIVKTADIY